MHERDSPQSFELRALAPVPDQRKTAGNSELAKTVEDSWRLGCLPRLRVAPTAKQHCWTATKRVAESDKSCLPRPTRIDGRCSTAPCRNSERQLRLFDSLALTPKALAMAQKRIPLARNPLAQRDPAPLWQRAVAALNVQIAHVQSVVFDELTPRFDLVAHQHAEQLVSAHRIVHLDLQ